MLPVEMNVGEIMYEIPLRIKYFGTLHQAIVYRSEPFREM